MKDATAQQIMFMDTEVQRMFDIGAWEEGRRSTWTSPMFLVPKLGTNKWRIIIDLRKLLLSRFQHQIRDFEEAEEFGAEERLLLQSRPCRRLLLLRNSRGGSGFFHG